VRPDGVTFRCANGTETIAAKTILWAAGVQASPLGQALAKATGAELDRAGRVNVQPNLALAGHPEIFVIGDLAHVEPSPGKLLPGVAQVALQEGAYVARLIQARLRGQTLPPFEYKNRGSMATIGHNAAVADLGWLRVWGFIGWLIWLFVHLLYIEQYHNRLLILIQWAWSYFTRNRSARLITGETEGAPNFTSPRSFSSQPP
jgi:NADH dehydrogenase